MAKMFSISALACFLSLSAGPTTALAQEWVVVKNGERQVHSYLARPKAAPKAVAVVVIHEIFGLTDWVVSVADHLAAEGYVAIAPDLLSGMAPNGGRTPDFADQSAATRAVSNLPPAQVTADLSAVAAHVAGVEGVKVVSAGGFCWGGSTTFNFATAQPTLAAAFVFYGSGPDSAAIPQIVAPVYAFYAGNDNRINATVPATTDQMKEAGKFYEPITYEGAGHGFMRSGEGAGASDANRLAREQSWTRWLGLLAQISPPETTPVEKSSWGEVKSR